MKSSASKAYGSIMSIIASYNQARQLKALTFKNKNGGKAM